VSTCTPERDQQKRNQVLRPIGLYIVGTCAKINAIIPKGNRIISTIYRGCKSIILQMIDVECILSLVSGGSSRSSLPRTVCGGLRALGSPVGKTFGACLSSARSRKVHSQTQKNVNLRSYRTVFRQVQHLHFVIALPECYPLVGNALLLFELCP
jgi:hypothetical protein